MTLRQLIQVIFLVLSMHFARMKYAYAMLLVVILVLGGALWILFFAAPGQFPTGQVITIAPGTSITKAASQLRTGHYLGSTFVFRELVRFMPGAHGVQSGVYIFSKPAGALTIAWNLSHGVSGIPTMKVTFPEGTTVRQMGKVLGNSLPNFDEEAFDAAALPAEGFLFPDTYFFLPGISEVEVVALMRANYATHIAKFADRITAFKKSEREVVIMASLLEGEGKTLEDKRMIAGILWNRITAGMPLQVDAPFGYIHSAAGYTPTAKDLASDSAYNTYRYKGLPPTPINNPGDESLLAALTPSKTDYVYYLTGTDGTMHYSKTFPEHIAKQKKYLK
jgi:UPF0755 protein